MRAARDPLEEASDYLVLALVFLGLAVWTLRALRHRGGGGGGVLVPIPSPKPPKVGGVGLDIGHAGA